MIGYGFMGRAHSNAYKQVGQFFPSQLQVVLKAACARDAAKVKAFADQWGYESTETDWRKLVERKDIDVIDICTPNNLHKEIALAAAAAGKMILCEKPLAMNAAEGQKMVEAVEKAGVANMVWYNYRRIPAVTLAKQLIEEGRLGKIFHYRAKFLQDWTIKADLPQGGQGLWRLDVAAAGSGVTGDLLAHCIDTAVWLNGRLDIVYGHDRDVRQGAEAQPDRQGGEGRHRRRLHLHGPVRQRRRWRTSSSTRYARGHKALYTFEINGENMSLVLGPARPAPAAGVRLQGRGQDPRLEVGPRDRQQPGPPVHGQVVGAGPGDRLRRELHAPGGRLHPGAGDGQAGRARLPRRLETQLVLDAILDSAKGKKWVTVAKG